jgi:PIN domain nuclease of toxin-antitoxin system
MLNKLKIIGVLLLFISLWKLGLKKTSMKISCAYQPKKLLKKKLIINELQVNLQIQNQQTIQLFTF